MVSVLYAERVEGPPPEMHAAHPNGGHLLSSGSAGRRFVSSVINQSLVANFGPKLMVSPSLPGSLVIGWITNFSGYVLQQNTNLHTTNWSTAAETISPVGGKYEATILTTNGPRFFRLQHP